MVEYIAVIFGVLSVWYAKNNNILVFPTGIISVVIYAYITYNNKLYADTGINIYYFIMSLYGWILWTSKKNNIKKEISHCSTNENVFSIIACVLFFFIIKYLLQNTDSDVVILDSITTALCLTGMLLLARRKIENWIYWIIADIIYIPLYIYKGLYPTSIQFIIFLILATLGYINWKKQINK